MGAPSDRTFHESNQIYRRDNLQGDLDRVGNKRAENGGQEHKSGPWRAHTLQHLSEPCPSAQPRVLCQTGHGA